MKCMLDTNILVSAALFPNSVTAAAYMKAVAPPHKSSVKRGRNERHPAHAFELLFYPMIKS